jgi:hypothetical protein
MKELEKTIKICIGMTEEKQIVYAELNIRKNNYFSITHTTLRDLITEEEGEQRVREYLEDGELWRMAVEAENTTQSLEDWVEEVLSVDGWEVQLDSSYFGEYEGVSYYSTWDSFGASIDDFKKEFKILLISQEDLDLIIASDKLHIKDFKKYTKKDKELFGKIKELIVKYESQKGYETQLIKAYLED